MANTVVQNQQTAEKGEVLLEVRNLKKYFQVRTGFVKKTDLKAVDDVSFFIRRGGRSCGLRSRRPATSSTRVSRFSARI